jgi:hypothetical protein
MSTTTLSGTNRQARRIVRTKYEGTHIGRIGLGTVGLVTVLISAWGGIVPYVGPLFGYDADGTGSWHWGLGHTLLALVPGAIGLLIGLLILGETRGVVRGRGRVSLATAGLIAVLCGAWFVVGPLALPLITSHTSYFVSAQSPMRQLENVVGYSMGPGLILAVCGGFTAGWASRHQERASDYEETQATGAPLLGAPS